jgi:hypothetical protein
MKFNQAPDRAAKSHGFRLGLSTNDHQPQQWQRRPWLVFRTGARRVGPFGRACICRFVGTALPQREGGDKRKTEVWKRGLRAARPARLPRWFYLYPWPGMAVVSVGAPRGAPPPPPPKGGGSTQSACVHFRFPPGILKKKEQISPPLAFLIPMPRNAQSDEII